MRVRVAERALMAGSVVAFVVAPLRWRAAAPPADVDDTPARIAPIRDSLVSDSALAEAEAMAVDGDPFRLSNSPPDVHFEPGSELSPIGGRAAPPPVRPAFVLKGIIGGPPWQAMIDGIPGQPSGTIAAAGAKYNTLTVRTVTRDSVVIQGLDTAWVLTFGGRP